MFVKNMTRYDYIDIARGIGILAVIWGHIILNHWSGGFVYTFHMPLFFFISGILFNRTKYSSFSQFAQKRAKRLFVPYLWYSIITWIIWASFSLLLHRPVNSYWTPLLQTIFAQGSVDFLVHNTPLWFIPCLFATEMMYYFTSKFNDIINFSLCLTFAGISILLEFLYGNDYLLFLPWNFDAALMALPFYAIGNLLSKHYSHQEVNDFVKQHKAICWCIVLILITVIIKSVDTYGSLSMGSSIYGNEYIFHIRALAGCVAILLLSILLSTNIHQLPMILRKMYDFIKWIGVVSLDVMCTHVPLKGFIIVIITTIIHHSTKNVMSNVGLALLVFFITLFIDSYVVLAIQSIKKIFKKQTKNK